MKIAVVGGGIFGCTIALKLKELYPHTVLFEQSGVLLNEASKVNQRRLHRGYHYPRSNDNVNDLDLFMEMYGGCVVKDEIERYYAISKYDSQTSVVEYLDFLLRNDLDFKIVGEVNQLPIIPDMVGLVITANEFHFNYEELKKIIHNKMLTSNLITFLNTTFTKDKISDFDLVINCTYSNINELVDEPQQYQFELCEKAIVKLGQNFKNKSIVVMDGEFCCVDPMAGTEYHLLGHVKEAVLDRSIGYFHNFDLNNIKSNYQNILNSCKDFFKITEVEYIRSMFAVRTVLPHREHDDARPSLITKHNDKLISVFGGKIGTSVSTANELIKSL